MSARLVTISFQFRLNFGHHCDHDDARSWNVVCKRKGVASRISNAIRTCTQAASHHHPYVHTGCVPCVVLRDKSDLACTDIGPHV